MNIYEIVYLDRDNDFRLLLTADGVAQDLSSVTKIELVDTSGVYTLDSIASPAAFDWISGDTGEVIIKLGHETVAAGKYKFEFYTYDATNTNGIYWGDISVRFVQLT
jgi:hypothetical protein